MFHGDESRKRVRSAITMHIVKNDKLSKTFQFALFTRHERLDAPTFVLKTPIDVGCRTEKPTRFAYGGHGAGITGPRDHAKDTSGDVVMSRMDFDEFLSQLAEERDPLVLEEIVRLYANDSDLEALEKLKEGEEKLHAELMSMKSNSCEAHLWFDVSSAIKLCIRQIHLIETALTEIRRRKNNRSPID